MVWESPWRSFWSHAVPESFQRIIVQGDFLTKSSVGTSKACLAPGLRHSLEASLGTGSFTSASRTTFLGINCPDAWVLRPQWCPVKTNWVARHEARERRMIPAEQSLQRTGCHQKSQKASVPSLGDRYLSACAQRCSTSATVSIPGCTWGPRACKEDPPNTDVPLYLLSLALGILPWIKIYLVYSLCWLLWEKWPSFYRWLSMGGKRPWWG